MAFTLSKNMGATVKTAAPTAVLNTTFLSALKVNPTVLQNLQIDTATTSAAADASNSTVNQPVEPISAPTYATTTASFGTIKRVDPIYDHLVNALHGIEQLRQFATESGGSGKALLARVEAYLQAHLGADYSLHLAELGVAPALAHGTPGEQLRGRFFNTPAPRIGATKQINNDKIVDVNESYIQAIINKQANPSLGQSSYIQSSHSALFETGSVVSADIRTMEALRSLLVKLRRDQQLELQRRQAELNALDARIVAERSTLSGLQARRAETLDDYAAAQRLLAENWQDVEQAWRHRAQVIDNNLGLFYVRVRETPMTRTLPDPLALRFGSADDIAPGIGGVAPPLPNELHPFLDSVLDIPAAEWTTLASLSPFLPGRQQLEQMVLLRRARIDSKQAQTSGVLAQTRLAPILQEQRDVARTFAARPLVSAALRDMQQQSHRILALEDLLASPSPTLRDPAQKLVQQLHTCIAGLLSTLRAIAPSIRLNWADLADANQLNIEAPQTWPQLARAEASDFNTLRTLTELIAWWFRQLAADASGESRTALRNVVRACLLLAASDDPQQLLQGQIKTLPLRLRPGELLRLNLNREPAPGNLLHIIDERQEVVASVQVQDHDDKGTLVSLAAIVKPGATLNLAMRVTGRVQ